MTKILRIGLPALTLALLAAIATCSLAPSPHMREMWWIPSWLGERADRYPNFRNMPVFAAFAFVLFFVFRFFSLQTAICQLPTSDNTRYQPLATRYGRWRLAIGAGVATALLGVLLEVLQLLFLSTRHFDRADIFWITTGAFVGAALAAACFRSLSA